MVSCFTKWNKVLSLHLFFLLFYKFWLQNGIRKQTSAVIKTCLKCSDKMSAVSMWLNGVKVEIACHLFVIIRWLTVYVSRNSKICCCLHAQKFTLTSRISLYRRQPVEFSLLLQIMPHATWVMLTHQTQSKVVSASICMQKLPEREKESVQWPDNHDLLWFGFFS